MLTGVIRFRYGELDQTHLFYQLKLIFSESTLSLLVFKEHRMGLLILLLEFAIAHVNSQVLSHKAPFVDLLLMIFCKQILLKCLLVPMIVVKPSKVVLANNMVFVICIHTLFAPPTFTKLFIQTSNSKFFSTCYVFRIIHIWVVV